MSRRKLERTGHVFNRQLLSLPSGQLLQKWDQVPMCTRNIQRGLRRQVTRKLPKVPSRVL